MTQHSIYCTPNQCSTFCDVRKAEHSASTESAKRSAIRDLVTELGHYASPDKLHECGWPLSSVETAVRKGWIRWTASGHLEVT